MRNKLNPVPDNPEKTKFLDMIEQSRKENLERARKLFSP